MCFRKSFSNVSRKLLIHLVSHAGPGIFGLNLRSLCEGTLLIISVVSYFSAFVPFGNTLKQTRFALEICNAIVISLHDQIPEIILYFVLTIDLGPLMIYVSSLNIDTFLQHSVSIRTTALPLSISLTIIVLFSFNPFKVFPFYFTGVRPVFSFIFMISSG